MKGNVVEQGLHPNVTRIVHASVTASQRQDQIDLKLSGGKPESVLAGQSGQQPRSPNGPLLANQSGAELKFPLEFANRPFDFVPGRGGLSSSLCRTFCLRHAGRRGETTVQLLDWETFNNFSQPLRDFTCGVGGRRYWTGTCKISQFRGLIACVDQSSAAGSGSLIHHPSDGPRNGDFKFQSDQISAVLAGDNPVDKKFPKKSAKWPRDSLIAPPVFAIITPLFFETAVYRVPETGNYGAEDW
jgi:hypothetical protein